ncbi:SMI1/KNR4 family protein [Paenibacillus spiritus]|uniref:SMI1/KNR4 family protein n=1 Tax=Paenibacillus spiritus TaxID=2496557 RepID=A0A5J5GCX4_9BACL|nr:SMI1/KNR4 family protein [Paenibacillus spiritus]KAA9005857.1 SMI1/KNR4 family protein [Paenibacillus spiritus]
MNEELRERLETYHEEDDYESIVEAVLEIPEEERDYEMVSHLGRALNNLERYEEALEQFHAVREEGKDDPLWHYRTGLALYYLGRYDEAQREFTIADFLEPGDEDTLEFLQWIREKKGPERAPEPVLASDSAARLEEAVVPAEPTAWGEPDGGPNAAGFWDDLHPDAERYVMEPPSDERVASVEEALVFKLPAAYVSLMKTHNGGIPRNRLFVPEGAEDQAVVISAILGIGREKDHSLCGSLGSRFLMEREGYPEFGVIIAECPGDSGVVMLDYRESDNDGEPEVVHVAKGRPGKITRLAPDFDSFIQGLVRQP